MCGLAQGMGFGAPGLEAFRPRESRRRFAWQHRASMNFHQPQKVAKKGPCREASEGQLGNPSNCLACRRAQVDRFALSSINSTTAPTHPRWPVFSFGLSHLHCSSSILNSTEIHPFPLPSIPLRLLRLFKGLFCFAYLWLPLSTHFASGQTYLW